MTKKLTVKKILLSLYHYCSFFIFMSVLVTFSMMLFLNTMAQTMGIVFNEENIKTAAIITFWNVVFLSLICTVIDGIRRKITIDRPVKKIVSAAEQIAKGDYSVRVPVIHSINRTDGLDEISECFNKMAEELSGVEALQTDFIANVSHELKTPLAVMQNYATLLRQTDLSDEERLHYAKSISEVCRRLAGLITNILKLNKLENQQIYPASKEYDLAGQLCECLLNFEQIWEEKNIDIETDIQENVLINADPELLSLVWNNLLSNAFKFTEKGGRVALSMNTKNDIVTIAVSDTGCGITPEVGKHIFDKFYQGDASHASQGNGLGLALVKRVVDIMGGDIAVSSEVGKGSTFTVKIRRSQSGSL